MSDFTWSHFLTKVNGKQEIVYSWKTILDNAQCNVKQCWAVTSYMWKNYTVYLSYTFNCNQLLLLEKNEWLNYSYLKNVNDYKGVTSEYSLQKA